MWGDSSDLVKGAIVGFVLYGVILPVLPAMLTARCCPYIMSRISMTEAMVVGALTSTAVSLGWFYYSVSNGFYAWVTFPTFPCVAVAIISIVCTFVLCYWWHNRKISPVD